MPPDAFAADVDVTSTVEINSSTANGPSLSNEDSFGVSSANIGDLNNDGVNDLAVGANAGGTTPPPYTDTTVVTLQTYDYQVPVSMKVESAHTPIY